MTLGSAPRADSGRKRAVIGSTIAIGIVLLGAGAAYFYRARTNVPSFETHAVTRRLSEIQYRNIIADVFGPDIVIAGRFEPEVRKEGLLAVGESQVSISQAGLEQYRAAALSVASQVVDRTTATFCCLAGPQSRPPPIIHARRQSSRKSARSFFAGR